MANSIKLRQRKMASGNIQLYLCYNINGKRWTEGLGMVLKQGKDRITKEQNRQTLAIAEKIANEKQKEATDAAHGIETKHTNENEDFLEYFNECTERKSGSTRAGWIYSRNMLLKYIGNRKLVFSAINKKWLDNYKDWLLGQVSSNSAAVLFSRVITCIHHAIEDEIIDRDPTINVKTITQVEKEREYLTEEELIKLSNTPIEKYPDIKRAFLFSCMTGLRISDVVKLRYEDIHVVDGRRRLTFTQTKTKRVNYIDLNDSTSKLIGEGEGLVFSLPRMSVLNSRVKAWVSSAGIKKHITFHCSRHTCATLLLTKGADIYTTSKILGHTNVKTTQIYAKIVDEKKRAATDLLDNII